MPGFPFRSRQSEPSGEPDAPDPDAARERAARLRELDEEIRRRGGELRTGRGTEHAAQAATEVGGMRPGQADPEETLDAPLAVPAEERELLKLAGRVEALESSLREAQQRSWEALQTQEELANKRLDGLEKRADDAAAKAVRAEAQVGHRLEKLSSLVDEFGGVHPSLEKRIANLERTTGDALEDRIGELEKRTSKAIKSRTRSREQIEKLDRRLAELEQALDGALEARIAGLEKWADEATEGAEKATAETDARIERLTGRIESVERLSRRVEQFGREIESARDLVAGVRSQHEPLERRITALEALELEAANGSRKLEQRVGETIERLGARTELVEMVEALTKRVDALDRHLSGGETRGSSERNPAGSSRLSP